MNITTYLNTSEPNRVAKKLGKIKEYTNCTAITPFDVVNPVIIINDIDFDVKCNYIHIQDTGRYYYVTVTAQSNKIFKLTCHCDVLMSFASQIKSQQAIIQRQEHLYNLYLADSKFKTLQKTRVQTKLLSPKDKFVLSDHSYILTTVSGG